MQDSELQERGAWSGDAGEVFTLSSRVTMLALLSIGTAVVKAARARAVMKAKNRIVSILKEICGGV